METYKILVGEAVHVVRQSGYGKPTRKDFANLMRRNVSASLVYDLIGDLSQRLCMDTDDVHEAWVDVMKDWQQEPCREQVSGWSSIAIGTELCHKDSNWIGAISSTRRVKKDCGAGIVYRVSDWGWYTLDELKEKFWLVE